RTAERSAGTDAVPSAFHILSRPLRKAGLTTDFGGKSPAASRARSFLMPSSRLSTSLVEMPIRNRNMRCSANSSRYVTANYMGALILFTLNLLANWLISGDTYRPGGLTVARYLSRVRQARMRQGGQTRLPKRGVHGQ